MNRFYTFLVALLLSFNAFSQAVQDTTLTAADTIVVQGKDSLKAQKNESLPDSIFTDSVNIAKTMADSLQTDSLLTDSLQTDSIPSDSLKTDSLIKDSIIKDTVIQEISPVKIRRIDPLDTITRSYMKRIENMVLRRDSIAAISASAEMEMDAYYYRLILPPTLYRQALHGVLTTRDSSFTDDKTKRLHAIHYALARTYVQYPWLVRQTDQDLENVGTLRNDITEQTIQNEGKLAEKLVEVELPDNLQDTIVVVTRRPKFWKVWGNTSLSFAQNHWSDNWHKGGEDAYSGVTRLNLYANFNNSRKIVWENSLAAELGFQTAKGDKQRTFRPTSNKVRLFTKIGYQAWKKLYYTTSVDMETKIVPEYNSGTDVCKADFLSPLDVRISVGIDFRFEKKKFTGSVGMAPVAYTIRYVERKRLATNFGVRPGHQSYHQWGPSVNVNASWPFIKNVNWNTRIHWFSNLKCTRVEWENNFNFTLSKYITASMRFYPRYDDSARHYKNKKGKYIMLEEWFNIGLNYGF